MSNSDWPKVRKRTSKVKGKAYTYYYVDLGEVDGKRKFIQKDEKGNSLRFKRDAERYAARIRAERNRIGNDAVRMSQAQKKDAIAAIKILEGHGTLADAASFYVRFASSKTIQKTVDDIVVEYLKEAESDNLRPRSIKDLRTRLSRFTEKFGESIASEISKQDVEGWLRNLKQRNGKQLSSLSKRHYRVVTSGMFNFALENSYVAINPFAPKTNRRKRNGGMTDERMPGIISIAEVQNLLDTSASKMPNMTPALAIGFFAGLRTSELSMLDWKNVDMKGRIITVTPDIAKKRYVRHIDISDNLTTWLEPFVQESGLITPQGSSWQYQFAKVRELASIENWPNNAMRHCFASYHLTMHQDQNQTALQLGHRDTDLLYRHYRNLATKNEAEKYWGILPENE